jgi:hypothetical protein
MGAYATLTIPLRITTTNERYDAREVLENIAGGLPPAMTDTEAVVSLQMPGNLDSLFHKLAAKGVLGRGPVRVSIPMRSLAIPERRSSGDDLLELLRDSPAISGPLFNGDRLEATIVPSTGVMRFIYEQALRSGLIPQDVPTLVNLRGL